MRPDIEWVLAIVGRHLCRDVLVTQHDDGRGRRCRRRRDADLDIGTAQVLPPRVVIEGVQNSWSEGHVGPRFRPIVIYFLVAGLILHIVVLLLLLLLLLGQGKGRSRSVDLYLSR